jgi:hypothetical protein
MAKSAMSELLKFRQLQGLRPYPPPPTIGALPLDLTEGKAPVPQYAWLALRTRHEYCPPIFQTVDTPLLHNTLSSI